MIGRLILAGTASGAVLGSVAGAALTRWSADETLLAPIRSRCGGCGHRIAARDLVPVLSWLVLKGRCRQCGSRIDPRIPALEIASVAMVTAIVVVHGPGPATVLLCLGAVAVALATLTDLEARVVPDRVSLPLLLLVVPGMLLLSADPDARVQVLAWSVGVPLILWMAVAAAMTLGAPRPLGGGDIKLLAPLLALTNVATYGQARLLALAVLLGGAHAGVGLATGRLHRRDRLPFVPSIGIAYLTVVLLPTATFPMGRLLGAVR